MRISNQGFYTQQIELMQKLNADIQRAQNQVTSGQKYLSSKDNPVDTYQLRTLDSYLSSLDNYKKNIDAVDNRSSLVENSMNNVMSNLQRASELITQAQSGTMSPSNLKSIAKELNGILGDVLRTANQQDSNGEYIFSGSKTTTKPFSYVDGSYIYNGDQAIRELNINPSSSMIFGDSGYDVFESIKNGNGDFQTSAANTNTGTGVIDSGVILNRSQYVADTYTINFVTNGGGNLAYTVTGASSGQVIPALPATIPANAPTYVPGQEIQLNGLSVTIKGQPDIGDQFQIQPSQSQNIFTTLDNLINVLNQNPSTPAQQAQFKTALQKQASSMQQAFEHFSDFLAEVGARAATIANEKDFNDSITTQVTMISSKIGGVDPTEAIMRFNQASTTLQMAQQTFLRVQNLSLMNYLK